MAAAHATLWVEDGPDSQALAAHIVNCMNIAADCAKDTEAAEASLFLADPARHYAPSVIDLALPGKSGGDLPRSIKADRRTVTLPRLAVTALHTSEPRETSPQVGFAAYFAGPLEATTLAQPLEAIL